MKSTPLKWFGGKAYLAKWIIDRFPLHTHYCEPYFGGGQVLLAKPLKWIDGISECVSDIYGELTNFWRVLRCPDAFPEFEREVSLIPFSQMEFERAENHKCRTGHSWENNQEIRPCHECAVAFFVRYRQSRQGLGECFATLSKSRTRQRMNEQVAGWLSAIDSLYEAHQRLQRVVILSRPALSVIQSEDSENTFFYLDPPYLGETREKSSRQAYGEHEMTSEDHERLLETLSGIKGKFLLSGRPSALYRRFEERNSWKSHSTLIDNKASGAKSKKKQVEILWANF